MDERRSPTDWLIIAAEEIRRLSAALDEATDLAASLDRRGQHEAAIARFREVLEHARLAIDRGIVED